MSGDLRVAVLVNRGEELANEGQYNSAIDEFQKAVDIDAHNSLALFRMGEALFELGNLQAAAGMFQEALNGDLKPKWVEVWAYINRGKIFDIRGQRERATTEYQKAVNTGDDSYGAQAEAEKYSQRAIQAGRRPRSDNNESAKKGRQRKSEFHWRPFLCACVFLFVQLVVRRLFRDEHIMHVALAKRSICDFHESSFLLQFFDRFHPAVTHAGP